MQKELLNYVCCPRCKGDLQKKVRALLCNTCQIEYEINRGIPVLINKKKLPSYLVHQIAYFENEDDSRPVYKLEAWQKSFLRRFYQNIKIHKRAVILDIACGSGYMAIELAKKGMKVIACDLTIKQLYKLQKVIDRKKLSKNIFLVCCSAEALPYKNSIADVIIENAILEHLPYERKAISEIDRVAKNKSYAMISVPLAYKFLFPFFIPINIIHDRKIGHLRRYTKKDLTKKMKQFSLFQLYYSGHLVKYVSVLINVLFKTSMFDEVAEKIDRFFENVFYGGTVITAFFKRG